MDKEQVYDEVISPLMMQIIETCKKHGITLPDTMTDRDGKSFIVLASQSGSLIHAVIIPPGEVYGLDNCLVHDGHEPLVEFWDATHAGKKERFDPEHGQFVSRYYVSTIAELDEGRGLYLHGGEPSWVMSGESMDMLRTWIQQHPACQPANNGPERPQDKGGSPP